MSTTLNSRITRTFISVTLALGMSFSLAGNSLADAHWTTEVAARNPAARAYSFTLNGTTITVRLDSVSDTTVNGVVLINTTELPFAAQSDGQTLKGMVVYGGNECPFTATIQGTVMYFKCFGTEMVLQQVA